MKHKKTEEVVDAKIIEGIGGNPLEPDFVPAGIQEVRENVIPITEEVPVVAKTVDELSSPKVEIESATCLENNRAENKGSSVNPPEFSEPQPSVPVEIKIEPVETVKRAIAEVDKEWLFKMLYSLGTGSTWQYQNISLVNKIPDLFGMSREDGLKKWEEIKEWYGKQ